MPVARRSPRWRRCARTAATCAWSPATSTRRSRRRPRRARRGLVFIHAFDDPDVVAGQGTIGLEIAEQAPDDAADRRPARRRRPRGRGRDRDRGRLPGARVVGVQAEALRAVPDSAAGAPPDRRPRRRARSATASPSSSPASSRCRSSRERRRGGHGLRRRGRRRRWCCCWSARSWSSRGPGAVAVAAILHGKVEPPADGETCAVLSGGNVDASRLAECIRLGETAAGRRMVLVDRRPRPPGRAGRAAAMRGRGGRERARRDPPARGRRPPHPRDRDPPGAADRRAVSTASGCSRPCASRASS